MILNAAGMPLANMYILGHIPKKFKLKPYQIAFVQWALLVIRRILLVHWNSRTPPKVEMCGKSVMFSSLNCLKKLGAFWKDF